MSFLSGQRRVWKGGPELPANSQSIFISLAEEVYPKLESEFWNDLSRRGARSRLPLGLLNLVPPVSRQLQRFGEVLGSGSQITRQSFLGDGSPYTDEEPSAVRWRENERVKPF